MDKLGVEATIVTAGKWKDTGSPFPRGHAKSAPCCRRWPTRCTQFIDAAVAAGRKLGQRAREIANGRVYTGEEGRQIGLVDELGGLETPCGSPDDEAGSKAGPRSSVSRRRGPWWWRALFSERSRVAVPAAASSRCSTSLASSAEREPRESRTPQLPWRLPFATEGFRW